MKSHEEQEVEDHVWLEGAISVAAALQGGSRKVAAVYLRQEVKYRSKPRFRRLERLAASSGVPVHRVDEHFFQQKASGKSHGGVLAEAGPREMLPLEKLCSAAEHGFVVMLDGIEDPFNFGQSVRALYAAGVDGIVLRPRNWMTATAVVTRASAGATELVPMAIVSEVEEAVSFFRGKGYQVACTGEKGSLTLFEADLRGPLFLLLGGEKRGITRSFLSQADLVLRIPYGREYDYALGTAMSAAVVGFEVLRQRS